MSAVTGYEVRYSFAGGAAREITVDAGVTAVISGLRNGITYEFSVCAANNAGCGAYSDPASAKPVGVPGPVRNLEASDGMSGIVLEWDKPLDTGGGISDYVIIYKTAGGGDGRPWLAYDDGVGTRKTATVAGLDGDISYHFRVYAVNDAGDGAESGTVTATARVTKAGAPVIASVVPGNGSVTAKWSPPDSDGGSEITHYRIAIVDASTDKRVKVSGVPAGTSHTFHGLENGKEYFVVVGAVTEAGIGHHSQRHHVTPEPAKPGKPTVTLVTAGDGYVRLEWSPPGDDGGSAITHYDIGYSAVDSATIRVKEVPGASSFAVISGLENGRAYAFHIHARNAVGHGDASPDTEVTPSVPVPPGPPRDIRTHPGDSEITVSWYPPIPASPESAYIKSYDVDYRPVGGGGGGSWYTAELPGTITSRTVKGLANGQEYEFRIRVTDNNDLRSEWSQTVTGSPTPPASNGVPVPDTSTDPAECNPATDANHCCTAIGQEITMGGDDQVYHVCTAEDLSSETVEGGSERVPVTHDESHPTCSISLRDPPTTIPGTGYGRVSGTATQVIGNVGTSALTGIMISVSDWTYEDGETAPGMHREIRTHGSAEWTEVRPGMPAHVTDGLPLPGSGDGLAVEYRVDMTGNTDGAGKGPISQTITYAASCS